MIDPRGNEVRVAVDPTVPERWPLNSLPSMRTVFTSGRMPSAKLSPKRDTALAISAALSTAFMAVFALATLAFNFPDVHPRAAERAERERS